MHQERHASTPAVRAPSNPLGFLQQGVEFEVWGVRFEVKGIVFKF